MSVKQRLIKYLDTKKITKAYFVRAIGVSNSYINNMRQSISPDKLEKILEQFPDLNTTWLLTGDGDMLLERADGNLNYSGNVGNTQVGDGNNINIALPAEGSKKIIHSDGRIEISSETFSVSENITQYADRIKYLENQIEFLKDQIVQYKNIIEEQKSIINLLKNK